MNDNPVRQSFNRAASSYATTALLQQQVAEQLIHDLRGTVPADFSGVVLDAGCGTGYCLTQLTKDYPAAQRIGVDFAESMLRALPDGPAPYRINADLQQLPLANASVDLYVSSLAWQWCNLDHAIHEAGRVMRSGGLLWLTTLVAGTFHELKDTLCDAGLTPEAHVLTTAEVAEVLSGFNNTSMHLVNTRCDALTTLHPDFAGLRRSIRGVGANHAPIAVHEPINRAARQRLIDAYETRRTPQGLPLTYNVLTIHAQRI